MNVGRRPGRSHRRPREPHGLPAVAIGAAAVIFAGCQEADRPEFVTPLPPAPAIVEVRMLDNVFEFDTDVPAGRAVFRIRNDGKVAHRLTLLPLAEELPPIREQLTGSVRQAVAPFAGIPNRLPGRTGTFAVDLLPGRRYAMVCFVRDPDGTSHAVKGMAAEFRTPGPRQQSTTTTSSAAVRPVEPPAQTAPAGGTLTR